VAFAVNGTATDPTAVTLEYQLTPGGAKTTWIYGGTGSITKSSVGNYSAPIDTTTAVGQNPVLVTVKWVGTGTCQIVEQAQFPVTAPSI
jgi:hypothetical protein